MRWHGKILVAGPLVQNEIVGTGKKGEPADSVLESNGFGAKRKQSDRLKKSAGGVGQLCIATRDKWWVATIVRVLGRGNIEANGADAFATAWRKLVNNSGCNVKRTVRSVLSTAHSKQAASENGLHLHVAVIRLDLVSWQVLDEARLGPTLFVLGTPQDGKGKNKTVVKRVAALWTKEAALLPHVFRFVPFVCVIRKDEQDKPTSLFK